MEIRALCCNCFFLGPLCTGIPTACNSKVHVSATTYWKRWGFASSRPGSVWEEEMSLLGWHKGLIGGGNLLEVSFLFLHFFVLHFKKKTIHVPSKGTISKRNVVFQVFFQQTCQFSGGVMFPGIWSHHCPPPKKILTSSPWLWIRNVQEGERNYHIFYEACLEPQMFFFFGCLLRHLPYLHGKNGWIIFQPFDFPT